MGITDFAHFKDPVFIPQLFNNWKKAIEKFKLLNHLTRVSFVSESTRGNKKAVGYCANTYTETMEQALIARNCLSNSAISFCTLRKVKFLVFLENIFHSKTKLYELGIISITFYVTTKCQALFIANAFHFTTHGIVLFSKHNIFRRRILTKAGDTLS